MKRAIFLRHAKAYPAEGEPDHDRGLSGSGRFDAERAGRAIAKAGWRPDLALVSDARRTRETVECARPALDPGLVVRFDPALYDASPEAILALVKAVPDTAECLLVVGHNPGIGEIARRLAATGPAGDLRRLRGPFPTAAMAVLTFGASRWGDIAPRGGDLEACLWVQPPGGAE